MLGCGGSQPATRNTPAPRNTPAARTAPSMLASLPPQYAALRPESARAQLQALESNPSDPIVLADAAHAFARTDTAGMTLVWGLMAGARGADAATRRTIRADIEYVLLNRITRTSDGVSTRLAPGSTPAIAMPDGHLIAPFAHIFEQKVGTAIVMANYEGEVNPSVLTRLLHALSDPNGPAPFRLGTSAPIFDWLHAADEAQQLDAFATWLFEGTEPDAALAAWMRAHPFEVESAPMPDSPIVIQ